ncbi:MAG: hypothetical protein LBV27_11200, partial [Oscillospiraceae bacterium]|nr:hypothetical protein [Oscillospiraceae bacterium]
MKIGVALSGCDAGGLSAYTVLEYLEDRGYDIEMVSASCVPVAAAMMYTCGFDAQRAQKSTAAFFNKFHTSDTDSVIDAISQNFTRDELKNNKKAAVNAVNVTDGRIITFTNAFSLDTQKIRSYPLDDAYDALSATISPMDGLGSYRYKDTKLCDFSVWYGCPLFPLKMSGIEKIVSIAFLPAVPDTPYEVLVKQVTESNAQTADAHV